MSGAVKAGEAFVEVTLRDKIKEGSRRIQAQLSAVSASIKSYGAGLATAGASATAAFGLIAGAIGTAAASFAETGAELDDMSQRTGVAASALSALSFAAEMSGTTLAEVEGGLKKMQKLLGDAAGGSKEAADKFAKLGLSSASLLNMSPEKQFMTISEAIAKIKDPTLQAAMAMEIFGRSGTQLLQLINSDIKKVMARAKELGLVMSQEDVDAAAALDDAIKTLSLTFKAVYKAVGAAVTGPLTMFTKVATDVTAAVGQWVNKNRELFVAIGSIAIAGTGAGAVLLTLGGALLAVGGAIAGIATAVGSGLFATIAAGITAALPVVGAITAAFIAAGAAWGGLLYIANQAGILSTVLNGIGAAATQLWGTIKQTFGGITQALSDGQYTKAAEILWAGVKVAFLQGAKAALEAFSWLFKNALQLATDFASALGQAIWNVFTAIPQMLIDALSGGVTLAEILSKALSGGLQKSLDESLAKSQAELSKLTAGDKKGTATANQPGKGNQAATGNQAAPAAAATAGEADSTKAIQERIKALQDETLEMRLGANAFDLLKLKQQGATEEQLRQVQALQAYRDQLNAKAKADEQAKASMQDMIERGKQMANEVRTPFQVMSDRIKEINQLQAAGAIDGRTADLQRQKATQEFRAPMVDAMKSGRNTIANINSQEAMDTIKRTRDSYIGGNGASKEKGGDLAAKQLEQLTKIAASVEKNTTTPSIKINVRRI